MIDDLLSLAGEAVSHAKKLGADAVHAVAADGRSTEISILDGKIEKVEQSEARDISLKVYAGKSSASISGSVLTKEAIHRLAENALNMARLAPPDPYAGVAEPEQLAKDIPDLDLAGDDLPDPKGLEDMARRAEAAGLAVKGVTKSSGAGASRSETSIGIVISNGFSQGYRRTGVGLSMSAIAGEGQGMQRDYDYSSAVHFADLRDPETIGRSAGERAAKRVDPRKVKSQSVPVIYDRRVASGLIGHLLGAINGAAIARGTSFLKDQLGQADLRLPHHHRGRPLHPARPRLAPLRRRGAGLPQAEPDRPGRADGLDPRSPLGPPAGAFAHGTGLSRGTLDVQRLSPAGRAVAGAADRRAFPGALCHRTHRLLHQHGDGRLQPGRLRFLDRERRTHLPGERDHHRRKPQGHVQDRAARQQPRIPLIGERAQLPGRRTDHCRCLTRSRTTQHCCSRRCGQAGELGLSLDAPQPQVLDQARRLAR
jgi:hypothetical protein